MGFCGVEFRCPSDCCLVMIAMSVSGGSAMVQYAGVSFSKCIITGIRLQDANADKVYR